MPIYALLAYSEVRQDRPDPQRAPSGGRARSRHQTPRKAEEMSTFRRRPDPVLERGLGPMPRGRVPAIVHAPISPREVRMEAKLDADPNGGPDGNEPVRLPKVGGRGDDVSAARQRRFCASSSTIPTLRGMHWCRRHERENALAGAVEERMRRQTRRSALIEDTVVVEGEIGARAPLQLPSQRALARLSGPRDDHHGEGGQPRPQRGLQRTG